MTWERVKLGEIAAVISGATPKTGIDEYWDGEIAWATPRDLSKLGTKYIEKTESYISELGYRSCSTVLLPPDSVLLSSRAPIGHVAVNAVPMATNQGFKSLIPKRDRLDANYLYHWLKSQTAFLNSLGRGATFKEVSKPIVENIEIPLPPLPIQQRIAAVLDEVDALRQKRERSILAINSLAAATFREMFGDVVNNTRGFEVQRFGEIAIARLGKMLDKNHQTSDVPKPYLRNTNVQWDRLELQELNTMTFNENEIAKFSLRYGDLLVCEGGEVGRAAIWRDELQDCYFQKAVHRIRPNSERVKSEYLLHYLWQMASGGGLKDFVTVATIAHLTGEKLALLPVPIPPMSGQEKFKIAYDEIREQKIALLKALGELETFTASLQARAFAGELELRELEGAL